MAKKITGETKDKKRKSQKYQKQSENHGVRRPLLNTQRLPLIDSHKLWSLINVLPYLLT